MDQTLFGLKSNPFTALPRGADVFIGPQTAGLLEALRPAFEARDAIAAVSGPAGAGKTTLVNYALDALYPNKRIARVGRAPLEPRNVLEALLIVLGVTNRPPGRDRRLVILRDALRQYAMAGISVIVVVEDAPKSGAAVLAELAALTVHDKDESAGARMVLMGADSLAELLRSSELVDLNKRVALRHELNALSAAETRGYLLHCFRTAGGDFNQIFDSGCSELLHRICDGNPRAINQLAEVVLRTADELNLSRISARFAAEVAAQIYDPKTRDFKFVNRQTERDSAAADPLAEIAAATNTKSADDKSEKIAQDIMNAKRLEDLDDVMAETLFGEEMSELAAQAVGNIN